MDAATDPTTTDRPTSSDGTRVLVTGARGFVGAHVVAALEADSACAAVFSFGRGHGDLSTQDGADALAAILVEHDVDVVVHLAGMIGPAAANADPAGSVAANAGATLLVATACAAAGVRLVLGSTTDAALPAGRSNAYALPKAWGEQAALLAAPEGLRVLRLCGPYGPGSGPGARRNALAAMAAQAVAGEPLRAWRGVGRRWCHVSDVARAISLVAVGARDATGAAVLDVGSNDLHELPATARRICELAGADAGLVEEVDPPVGVGDAAGAAEAPLDLSGITSLGWQPQVAFDAGLLELLAWVRESPVATPA